MEQGEVIYQDRLLKITKYSTKDCKYKIEITVGRFCKSWEEYCTTNEQIIERSKRKLKSLYRNKCD